MPHTEPCDLSPAKKTDGLILKLVMTNFVYATVRFFVNFTVCVSETFGKICASLSNSGQFQG